MKMEVNYNTHFCLPFPTKFEVNELITLDSTYTCIELETLN